MKLIIGLGNPGKEYAKTRHNVGWMVLDLLRNKEKGIRNKKINGEIYKIKINNNDVLLLKPLTSMNESGKAVRVAIDYYKIKPNDIIVVHDDKDIVLGEIKVQTDRSSAGHNGVQSIIDHFGTQNFTRVRVGVGRENREEMGDTSEFVLSAFNKEEKKILDEVIKKAIQEIKKYFRVYCLPPQ